MGNEIFRVEIQDDVAVLTPLRSMAGANEETNRRQVAALTEQLRYCGVIHLVFDFGEVSYFGSMMLDAMVRLWREIREEGGRIAICNLSGVGTEILHVSRFDMIWPVYPSMEEALEAVHCPK